MRYFQYGNDLVEAIANLHFIGFMDKMYMNIFGCRKKKLDEKLTNPNQTGFEC